MIKKKIMIVDDDPLLAQTMDICLRGRGHEVRAVSSGVDAVRCLFKERPDVVVVDVSLPDCDGWFLTRLLSKLDWAARIPVIVMSVLDPDRSKMAESRPFAYIQKPFDMGRLLDIVEESLDKELVYS